METAQQAIETAHEEMKTSIELINDLRERSKEATAAELLTKQTKLSKYASMVGKALRAVQAAATIANFAFTFFMPSDLDVITSLINERFKEVKEVNFEQLWTVVKPIVTWTMKAKMLLATAMLLWTTTNHKWTQTSSNETDHFIKPIPLTLLT